MLLRPDGDDVICIGQPAHAWLSGQLARKWHPRPEPYEEVCLAAMQHDIGMADWDAAPELNRETGLPQSFMEMALDTHLELWRHAPQRVLPQSRYAALLVSMHGTALYEMRDLERMPPENAAKVRAYLDRQRALQQRLQDGLDPNEVKRNQQLLWTWDFLSLALCLRWDGRAVNGIEYTGTTFEPWPFRDESVTLMTEGRRLAGRFDDEQGMRVALEGAPWVTLEFRLSRA
jgi:hypothetical protein